MPYFNLWSKEQERGPFSWNTPVNQAKQERMPRKCSPETHEYQGSDPGIPTDSCRAAHSLHRTIQHSGRSSIQPQPPNPSGARLLKHQ